MKKDLAVKLRIEGKSYNQISSVLGVAKSTLNYWLKDIKLSDEAQELINQRVKKTSIAALIIRNKNQSILARKRAELIKEKAKREFKIKSKNKLFLAGVALYWAEGYKKGALGSKWKSFDFANADPEMIKLMALFLKKHCGVDYKKIKIQILAHPNININRAVSFWSHITKVPKNQFIKTCFALSRSSQQKRNKKSLPNGTVHLRVNDVKLFFRVIGWIDGLKESLK